MFKLFSAILTALATGVASLGSQACVVWYFDEPNMPSKLIN